MKYFSLSILSFLISFYNIEHNCKDQGIKIEYLKDIDKLIKNGYKCESNISYNNVLESNKYKVLFSDSNYKIIYNGYKTRLLIDKKENIILAINSVAPDFRIINKRPFAIYVLDNKLMPIYAIAKLGGGDFSAHMK